MTHACVFCILTAIHSPFALDSTLYSVDISNMVVKEQHVRGNIIDYSLDDYLYVLTARYLYKVDPDDLVILDRTILPQTFTTICTNHTLVVLVSAGEIVLLNKSNLAFITGIGMSFVDLQPIVSPQGQTIARNDNTLYVLSDEGDRSILRIIDLNSGGVVKALSVHRIQDYYYDVTTSMFTVYNTENRLITFDLDLNQIIATPLSFTIDWFRPCSAGYTVGTPSGIFLITPKGSMIDNQPLMRYRGGIPEYFLFLTGNDLLHIDSLTLRPRVCTTNVNRISSLFSIGQEDRVLGMDDKRQFYFVHLENLILQPGLKSVPITIPTRPLTIPLLHDSLWYVQLGAFTNIDNALNLYDELRMKMIPVFIDSSDLYRIRLGGFMDKETGMMIVERLGISGWFSYRRKISNTEVMEFYIDHKKYVLTNGMIERSTP